MSHIILAAKKVILVYIYIFRLVVNHSGKKLNKKYGLFLIMNAIFF